MNCSKMCYVPVFVGLLAFSAVSHAAVEDFGRLSNNASVTSSIDFTSPANVSNTSLGGAGVEFAGGVGVNGLDSVSNNQFRRGGRSGHSDKGRLRHRDDHKKKHNYTPIASPVPEPETYAMILAGLALIGVTARRRRQDQQ